MPISPVEARANETESKRSNFVMELDNICRDIDKKLSSGQRTIRYFKDGPNGIESGTMMGQSYGVGAYKFVQNNWHHFYEKYRIKNWQVRLIVYKRDIWFVPRQEYVEITFYE